jgi:protoporphyrinogen/coproporphyrinogen III oxidase
MEISVYTDLTVSIKPEPGRHRGNIPAMVPTRDVLVVGAGITGLTAAFHLLRGGLDVAVVEAAERVGGSIETARPQSAEGAWIFERGPNTVLEGPAMARLVREAGLSDDLVAAAGAGKRRYVWKDGRLLPLPSGPKGLVTTPLFPGSAKLRLLKEPFVGRPGGRREGGEEESIAELVRRRLGEPFLDYAVGPFVSGVYAGDPERLSARWAMPRLHALEERHGSLIRGALAAGRGRRKRMSATGGRGGMISMDQGLDTLPRRLAEVVDDVRTGAPCLSVRTAGDRFEAETEAGTVRAHDLVLALPAAAVARVLDELTGGRGRAFEEIPYAPVAVASYGFRREDVEHPLDGFGFLAPRKESLRVLGCLFPSSLFPGRAPAGCVALTAFVGGSTDPEALELDDGALHELVLGDLRRALGIAGEPRVRDLARWPRAIPQYEVGHGRFVELGRALERELPRLHLAGSFLHGVSLPDCVANGTALAERLLQEERTGVHRRITP